MSDIYKDFWEEANKYDAEHPIQVIKVRVDENPSFNLEILKQNIDSIIPSINAVHSGNMVFDSEIVSSLKRFREKDIAGKLSDREMDILMLLADGLNNKEIANKLYLSEGTVRNYISTMLDKLALRDRTQLAIYYYKSKFGVDD